MGCPVGAKVKLDVLRGPHSVKAAPKNQHFSWNPMNKINDTYAFMSGAWTKYMFTGIPMKRTHVFFIEGSHENTCTFPGDPHDQIHALPPILSAQEQSGKSCDFLFFP